MDEKIFYFLGILVLLAFLYFVKKYINNPCSGCTFKGKCSLACKKPLQKKEKEI
ncbi:MAG: hypothetical protein WC501_00545 [Candidatus Micrarchaeia archaeon]